jgi:hypothetical protein
MLLIRWSESYTQRIGSWQAWLGDACGLAFSESCLTNGWGKEAAGANHTDM